MKHCVVRLDVSCRSIPRDWPRGAALSPTRPHRAVPGGSEHRQRPPAHRCLGTCSPWCCGHHPASPAPRADQRASSCPLRRIPRQNETSGQDFNPQLCWLLLAFLFCLTACLQSPQSPGKFFKLKARERQIFSSFLFGG